MGIDLALERDTKISVSLEASALARHCAVLAQSGSGKSFMMGRLIEELLINRKFRLGGGTLWSRPSIVFPQMTLSRIACALLRVPNFTAIRFTQFHSRSS